MLTLYWKESLRWDVGVAVINIVKYDIDVSTLLSKPDGSASTPIIKTSPLSAQNFGGTSFCP